MSEEFGASSTEDLLRMIRDPANDADDFVYRALWCLFTRWGNGIDLEPLAGLLESDQSKDRLRGCYYLCEALPPSRLMMATAVKLADDPLGYCRRAFVDYVWDTDSYDETIANKLASCIFDFDLHVRIEAMSWAVYTTDERFDDLGRLVATGVGTGYPEGNTWREPEFRRGIRALAITEWLRRGESVEDIRKRTPDEDSFTFDHFACFASRTRRHIERRQTTGNSRS